MKFSWLTRAPRRQTPLIRKPKAFRPAVEGLERRDVLSTVYVVPMYQTLDATHRHLLNDAANLAGANGTVIVEPGSTPDAAAVSVTQAGLTIQGEPTVPGSILPRYDVNVNANQVKLTNLNLGTVTVAATANKATVSQSQLFNFFETGAAMGAGQNVLSQNFITGSVDLQGNSGLLQPTGDTVDSNTFASAAPIVVKLTNSNGTMVRDNTILGDASSQVGIQVRSNSDNVLVANNTVTLSGTGSPIGIVLLNTGGAAGNIVGARVLNNTVGTAGIGTGLYINIFGTGSGMVAQVEGNEFHGNKVGVDVNGITGSATGAGNVDLGGGSNSFGTSKGGNNFRGYDGQNGHFAINLHNTDAGNTVIAKSNIFDAGANASKVVRDGANGGGTGSVTVTSALDADHAFVQNLYTKLLGHAGSPAAGSDLDFWVGQLPSLGRQGVASAILNSTESLNRIVGKLYVDYLGRTATAAEKAYWVSAFKMGATLEQVQNAILTTVEYLNHNNTNYIQSLYLNLLRHPATTSDLTYWYQALPALGLQGTAAAFTGSLEYRALTVQGYFHDFLHRPAGANGGEVLAAQPGHLLAIQAAILGSDEFYANG